MKNRKIVSILSILFFALSWRVQAQENISGITKSFTNPSIPSTLIVENHKGDIHIEGYEGKDVIIQIKQEKLHHSLQPYPFSVEEKNNTMYIKPLPPTQLIDFYIKVPYKTTLKLKILKSGDIDVKNIRRLVEVDSQNGGVNLENLQGWAIVNTINGDIKASFSDIIHNKAMSFIAFDGSVSIDLPQDIQADFRMKSTEGTIYNEFNMPDLIPENNNTVVSNYSQRARVSKDKTSKRDRLQPKDGVTLGEIPDTQNLDVVQEQKEYIAPSSYQSQANGGGPVFFISSRKGDINIIKK